LKEKVGAQNDYARRWKIAAQKISKENLIQRVAAKQNQVLSLLSIENADYAEHFCFLGEGRLVPGVGTKGIMLLPGRIGQIRG